jgi:hypothetical protein
LARALTAEGTQLIHGMVALVGSEFMYEQLLWLVQRPGAPNLGAALAGLPVPLSDLNGQMERENAAVAKSAPNAAVAVLQRQTLKPAMDRVRADELRMTRQILLLMAIESLREQAARHQGQSPSALPQPSPKRTPASQPSAGQGLEYKRVSSTKAVLTARMPAGNKPESPVHCEITLTADR